MEAKLPSDEDLFRTKTLPLGRYCSMGHLRAHELFICLVVVTKTLDGQRKAGRVYLGSQLEGTAHHSGEGTAAGV